MSLSRKIAAFAVLAGMAAMILRKGTKPARGRHAPAFSDCANRETNLQAAAAVRPAGAGAMRDPPRDWDQNDESSDESFPASDSAAKY